MPSLFSESNLKFTSIMLTAILGGGGLLINLIQMQRSAALEARRPFLEKQLDLCFQATDAAASIAAGTPAPVASETPSETFRRLYLGKLALVEDQGVACAMTRFGRATGANLLNKQPLPGGAIDCPDGAPTIQQAALDLAQACRKLIITGWGADLPPETRQPGR